MNDKTLKSSPGKPDEAVNKIIISYQDPIRKFLSARTSINRYRVYTDDNIIR